MDLIVEGIGEALRLLIGGDPGTYHAAGVSLTCTVCAVFLAAVIGIPYGAWLGFYRRNAKWELLLLRLGMGVPTVVIGLIVYSVLSRRGLLGSWDLLYTQTAIIIGEFLLALPLIGALTYGVAATVDRVVLESSLTLGASRIRALVYALGECRPALVSVLLAAFGRCLTELGIAVTVGGSLAGETRTLPAAIQLELSRGAFGRALAPGLILLGIALVVTVVSHRLGAKESS